MEEERSPQQGQEEEVEAHRFHVKEQSDDPQRMSRSEEGDEDEVEAHRFRAAGPEDPGRRS